MSSNVTHVAVGHRANSRKSFSAMYNLTLHLCGLTANQVPCSKGFSQCWRDILQVWENHSQEIGCENVLYSALFHLHWGKFEPNVKDPALQNLLLLVEKELLDDGYAFKAWHKHNSFQTAFQHILDSVQRDFKGPRNWHAHAFRRYLYSRTFSRVIYKNSAPKSMWTHMTSRDLYSFSTATALYEYHHIFEQVITWLLPAAVGWTHQWTDEGYIMSQLYLTYQKDFTLDYPDFDQLIDAMESILTHQRFATKLLSVKNFSFDMADAIWGASTQKQLERLLSTARANHAAWAKKEHVRRSYSIYSRTNIQSCWLYRLMDKWYQSKDPRLTDKMRSAFLKLSMGI